MSNGTLLRSSLLRIGAMALLLASGCAAQDATEPSEASPPEPATPAEPIELVITATDHEFDLPGSLPAGRYEFTLVNDGKQMHQAQFYRLAEDVSFQELRDALLSRPEFAFDLPEEATDLVVGSPTGVLATARPGATARAKGALERGNYGVVCLYIDLEPGTGESSGLAHHALGMMAELTVT